MITEQQRFNELYQEFCIDNNLDNNLIDASLLLPKAVNNWPDNIAVICQDKSITYKELYDRSLIIANKLHKLGVKQNDRVIVFYENSIEFYIAYFAVWNIGAIVTPLNVFLSTQELEHIIKDSKPSAIIISPSLISRLDTSSLDKLPPLISDLTNNTNNNITEINNIITINITRSIDDTAAILYTSGTTGFPKGVMLSSRNIIVNALQAISRFEIEAQERVYCALPLFHSLPQNICLWTCTAVGATAIIVPKIDRKNLLTGLKYKPTIVVAVPALYGLFCIMKTIEFGPVRYFFSGGDALSDKTRMYFELIYRRKICNGYGLTETSPFISVDIDDFAQATSNVGRPFIGIDCSFRDENNNEVAPGSIGTLWVKGDNIMRGYYNAQQATDAILKDGWLNTGDLAYLDKNGKIVLAGRARDLIINKGIKIYPQEIENVLLSHHSVLQAGVVGIEHNQEEIPVAFIASKEQDYPALISGLKQLCKRNLASYKIPREFIVKKDLPLTATGKVDKKRLKAEYLAQK